MRRATLLVLVLLVVIVLGAGAYFALTSLAPQPAAGPTAASTGLPTGPHPTPQEETFNGCPAEGDGTDPELNRLKNRIDEGPWQPVTLEALLGLKWPQDIGRKHMAQWTPADHAQIDPFNGVPVQAEGYLLEARQEGPESPNCHAAEPAGRDFHTWLAAQPGDDRPTRSVVIEFTPRVRAKHQSWTLEALQGLVRQKTRVRISGWTMLDPEHPDEVGKSRGTIWEIHPVVKVETQQGGTWKDF